VSPAIPIGPEARPLLRGTCFFGQLDPAVTSDVKGVINMVLAVVPAGVRPWEVLPITDGEPDWLPYMPDALQIPVPPQQQCRMHPFIISAVRICCVA
jgi:hypothetical protein